ncbi:hypothetical protein ASZ90_002473 [hydrocarbon metagenome]|uniref:Uncharacterized protein n=1 Tax=hydrocarbon metagenome TaxID=938273 RepID=A0A0W8G3N5_9ZZZZ
MSGVRRWWRPRGVSVDVWMWVVRYVQACWAKKARACSRVARSVAATTMRPFGARRLAAASRMCGAWERPPPRKMRSGSGRLSRAPGRAARMGVTVRAPVFWMLRRRCSKRPGCFSTAKTRPSGHSMAASRATEPVPAPRSQTTSVRRTPSRARAAARAGSLVKTVSSRERDASGRPRVRVVSVARTRSRRTRFRGEKASCGRLAATGSVRRVCFSSGRPMFSKTCRAKASPARCSTARARTGGVLTASVSTAACPARMRAWYRAIWSLRPCRLTAGMSCQGRPRRAAMADRAVTLGKKRRAFGVKRERSVWPMPKKSGSPSARTATWPPAARRSARASMMGARGAARAIFSAGCPAKAARMRFPAANTVALSTEAAAWGGMAGAPMPTPTTSRGCAVLPMALVCTWRLARGQKGVCRRVPRVRIRGFASAGFPEYAGR